MYIYSNVNVKLNECARSVCVRKRYDEWKKYDVCLTFSFVECVLTYFLVANETPCVQNYFEGNHEK